MNESLGDITFRSATRDDIKSIHVLVAEERFLPKLSELELAYDLSLSPDLWTLAETKTGEIVGCCVGTVINEKFATMGPYIVRGTYRGRGIGKQLWAGVQRSLEGRNICVNASIPGVYRKVGFKDFSYGYKLMSGILNGDVLPKMPPFGTTIKQADDVPLEDIIKYDTTIHLGMSRSKYVRDWILNKNAITLVAVNQEPQPDSGSRVIGMGSISPSNDGWKIAPLYAEDLQTAEALLVELIEHAPKGMTMFAFVPTVKEETVNLANSVGLSSIIDVTPMYTMQEIPVPIDHVYALSSGSFALV